MKDRNSSVGGIGFFWSLNDLIYRVETRERYHMVMAMDIGTYVDTYDYRYSYTCYLCTLLCNKI